MTIISSLLVQLFHKQANLTHLCPYSSVYIKVDILCASAQRIYLLCGAEKCVQNGWIATQVYRD